MAKNEVSRKKYAKISLKKREKLIRMVVDLKKSIVQASKRLKLKLSTAKLILKKYKQTGTYFKKNMPDYCRRRLKKVKLEQNIQDQVKEVKVEDPLRIASSVSIEGHQQAEKAGGSEEQDKVCKKEQVLPTSLYICYFY